MFQQAADTGLAVLDKALNIARDVNRSDSLVAFTQPARVEPIVLFDSDCLYSELAPDVMQSLQSIFSGYYLQAWDMIKTLDGITVIGALEKLNPSRDLLDNVPGMESLMDMPFKLPMPGDKKTIAMEAGGPDNVREIKEVSNLSVGKLLEVDFKEGDKNVKIKVGIRLLVNSIPSDSLITILASGSKENSFMERYHQWRGGEIAFFRDLVACQDLIDEHKKVMNSPGADIYDAILKRRATNMTASILSRNLSVATASNLAVISSATATKLELKLGKPLKNFQIRQKIFERTYLMMMAVIDDEWDRVTIYTRGIPESTSLSSRDMKNAQKNNGLDVAAILAAFKAGSSPF
jgi:hypothetical protein